MATINSKTQAGLAVDVNRAKRNPKRNWLRRCFSEAHHSPSAASVVFTRDLPSTGGIFKKRGIDQRAARVAVGGTDVVGVVGAAGVVGVGASAVLTRRKPREAVLPTPSGQMWLRAATRQPNAMSNQPPPRYTRNDPDAGPRGSLPGEGA